MFPASNYEVLSNLGLVYFCEEWLPQLTCILVKNNSHLFLPILGLSRGKLVIQGILANGIALVRSD